MMTILVLHVAGGVFTGIAAAYAVVTLRNKSEQRYSISAKMLAYLATFEIATGTVFAVISTDISAAVVCERIVVYLSIVAVIEYLLLRRLNQITGAKLIASITVPITASLTGLVSALALGF